MTPRDHILEILDLSQPIQTRDGRAARLISTNETHQSGGYIYPLRAEVEHPNKPDRWKSWFYMRDGC
ncbi:hypothetical protein, partial [Methylobacterium sp. J-092]|uniref:hypothetical protein n=1 Tax=Methylobacterium sp. J-092 TaxID=2836667 RepID=UPI001FBB66B6